MSQQTNVYHNDEAVLHNTLLKEVCHSHGIDADQVVPMLPYGAANVVGSEARWYYFDRAISSDGLFALDDNLSVPVDVSNPYSGLRRTRILSFGSCNMACPYCKRDCQFVDARGRPVVAVDVQLSSLFLLAETAFMRGEIVRFSGGDPVMYARECLAIAEYMMRAHAVQVSVAHNGSAPRWVEKMLPFLHSVAIDVKAVPEKAGKVMGLSGRAGILFTERSFESISLCREYDSNILIDVRTPLFEDTTLEELLWIGEQLYRTHSRKVFWTLRLYSPVAHCDFTQPDLAHVIRMVRSVSKTIPNAWIGIRGRWQQSPMLFFKDGNWLNTCEQQYVDRTPSSGNRV